MSWYEWLLAIAGGVTAISAIVAFIMKGARIIKRWATKVEKAFRDVDTLVAHDREQYLSILRLTMMNSEMPISERLIAGEKYLNSGGNGDCKDYYLNDLVKKHIK